MQCFGKCTHTIYLGSIKLVRNLSSIHHILTSISSPAKQRKLKRQINIHKIRTQALLVICESGESAIPKRMKGNTEKVCERERERERSFLDIYTPLTHARGITLAMAAMFLLALQSGHSNQRGPPLPILVPLYISLSLSPISYNPQLRHSVNDVSFPVIACAVCQSLVKLRYM